MTSGRFALATSEKMPSDTDRSRAKPLAVRAAGQVRPRDIRVALNMSFILRYLPGIFAV